MRHNRADEEQLNRGATNNSKVKNDYYNYRAHRLSSGPDHHISLGQPTKHDHNTNAPRTADDYHRHDRKPLSEARSRTPRPSTDFTTTSTPRTYSTNHAPDHHHHLETVSSPVELPYRLASHRIPATGAATQKEACSLHLSERRSHASHLTEGSRPSCVDECSSGEIGARSARSALL
jgi:hypothetical protein